MTLIAISSQLSDGTLATLAAIVVALVSSWFATMIFFLKRLDAKLSDPATLDSIAARIRPELTFSAEGSILSDRGGVAFLSSTTIEIETARAIAENDIAPKTVIVRLNRTLDLPPTITSLTPEIVHITPHRHGGNDWRFEFKYEMTTKSSDEHTRKYRLEFPPK